MTEPMLNSTNVGGDLRRTNYRWVVCGLLFFATTINYIDRQVISLLESVLTKEMGWSEIDYGNIMAAFQGAYALGLLVVGGIIDKTGVKVGFFLAVLLWSIAAAAHGLVKYIPVADTMVVQLPGWLQSVLHVFGSKATSLTLLMTVFGFMMARIFLGLAEAGNFPACIKSISEWFPKKERALATGLFNSGTNVGALLAPLTVPWMAVHWGWPMAFYITGAIGVIWLVFWAVMYKKPEAHPSVSPAELEYIRSDPADPPQKMPWGKLLGYRQTWAFSIGKLLTDPCWWFYLFWIPKFLRNRFDVNIKELWLPIIIIYTMASVGSIGGGWIPLAMIKRGFSVNAARKTAMLICALCVVPVFMASQVSNLWVAVLLIGLACAAHQGWSCNIFTTASDTFPRKAVSSVVGIGGMFGAVGGMLIAVIVGYILEVTGKNYTIPFLYPSAAYLVALLIIHGLNPRLEPAKIEGASKDDFGGPAVGH